MATKGKIMGHMRAFTAKATKLRTSQSRAREIYRMCSRLPPPAHGDCVRVRVRFSSGGGGSALCVIYRWHT